jgi:hypothetical protein
MGRTWGSTALVVAGAVLAVGCVPVMAPAPGSASWPRPATWRENVAFVHQPVATVDPASLAGVTRIVFGNFPTGAPDPAAVALAARLRAEPWAYVQFTWFPHGDRDWLTVPAGPERDDWRLCNADGPIDGTADRTMTSARPWWYADLNERAYQRVLIDYLRSLKRAGYAGIWVDVAGRALAGPWHRLVSRCTEDPVWPGVTSADAFARFLGKVRRAIGLQVALNWTWARPGGDPRERPDPARPGRVRTDLVRVVSWVLWENGAHPVENDPAATAAHLRGDLLPTAQLVANLRVAAQAPWGTVVVMSKPRVPIAGEHAGRRAAHERHLWALAKLAGQPVATNTGDDWCGLPKDRPTGTDCNRTGYGRHSAVRLGAPVSGVLDLGAAAWGRCFEHGAVAVATHGSAPVRAALPCPGWRPEVRLDAATGWGAVVLR